MNNKIICFIDLFSAYQTVQYTDGQKERIPTEDLLKVLPQICYAEDCNKLHLYGDNNYCYGLAENIHMNENIEYGHNKIEIEVN